MSIVLHTGTRILLHTIDKNTTHPLDAKHILCTTKCQSLCHTPKHTEDTKNQILQLIGIKAHHIGTDCLDKVTKSSPYPMQRHVLDASMETWSNTPISHYTHCSASAAPRKCLSHYTHCQLWMLVKCWICTEINIVTPFIAERCPMWKAPRYNT